MTQLRRKRSSRPSERSSSHPTNRWLLTIDLVIGLMLVVAQAGAAWWFGGVSSTSQFVLGLLIVVALLLAWIRSAFSQSRGLRLPGLAVILFGAVLWGSLQTLPLPSQVAAGLGPETQRLRETNSMPAPPAAADINSPATLTLDPYATRMDWSLLSLSAAVFISASVAFHRSLTTAVTLVAIAANGLALAFFGLVQQMNWQGKIYWLFDSPGRASFGPFINPNNAGGYLNICLAAALGLTLLVFAEQKDDRYTNARKQFQSWWRRLGYRLRWEVAHLTARKLFVLTFAAFIVGGVFCTLSRGAIVALLFATALTTCMAILARKSYKGLIVATLLVVAGIGVANWVGMSGAISSELATLSNELENDSARLSLWQSLKPAAGKFWLTGSGLGTFRNLYRAYAQGSDTRWFYHAENQYIEAFFDAGLPGLMLMLAAIAGTAFAALLLIRRGQSRRQWALGFATIFALSSQVFHAGADFGLYLPANAWLLALLSGACCGEAMVMHHRPRGKISLRRVFQIASIAVWIGIVISVCLATVYLYRGSRLELAMQRVPASLDDPTLTGAELQSSIQALEPWCQVTGSAAGWQQLGDLWLASYRVVRLREIMPPGATLSDQEVSKLWVLTSPVEVHREAYLVYRGGGEAGQANVSEWLSRSRASQALALADLCFLRARACCPILSNVHLRLAQTCITRETFGDDDGEHLKRAVTLAPQRPSVLFLAGLLDLHARRLEECGQRWRRTIELAPQDYQDMIIKVALEQTQVASAFQPLSMDEFVDQMVPQDPEITVNIAESLEDIAGQLQQSTAPLSRAQQQQLQLTLELRDRLFARAETELLTHALTPEQAHTLGLLYKRTGDSEKAREAREEAQTAYESALAAFDKALVGPFQFRKEWLLERVQIYVDLEDFEQAQKEIDIVLSLNNGWGPAKKLKAEIDRLRAITEKQTD